MRTRARAEDGLGLVELLIAMTVLAIALLALVAAFFSGSLALRRAGQTSTAAALANQQMELYRGLKYCSIRLDDVAGNVPTTPPYTPYTGTLVLDNVACGGSNPTCAAGPPPECDASRDVNGADGRKYRVDTYIFHETPTGGRQLKRVTVVVRDRDNVTGPVLARTTSKFDPISG